MDKYFSYKKKRWIRWISNLVIKKKRWSDGPTVSILVIKKKMVRWISILVIKKKDGSDG